MSERGPKSPGKPSPLILALFGLATADFIKEFALLSAGQMQPWGDSAGYWKFAGDAAAGDWWLVESGQAWRTPGYPWFLALCRVGFSSNALFAAVLAQHVAVLATSAMVAWLVWRVTARKDFLVAAGLWCVCSTARPLYANWLLTEALATCALTAFVVALFQTRGSRPLLWLTAAAGVLGLGILIRPALLSATPAWLFAALCVWREGAFTWRQSWSFLMGPLICAALLTPWCLRNRILFDRFALTIFTGRELWKAAFDPWPGGELPIPEDGAGRRIRARTVDSDINLRHNWSVAGKLAESGLRDDHVDELMEACAWQAIGRSPGRFVFRTFARCLTFWYVWEWKTDLQHDEAAGAYAQQFRWNSFTGRSVVAALLRYTPERTRICMWLWTATTWLGIAGLLLEPRARREGAIVALVLLGTTILTATLEVPLYRYRLVVEPLMIVAALGGMASWLRLVSAGRGRSGGSVTE